MRTTYLKKVEVSDGFSGHTSILHLCYDPESLKTIAVHAGGYFRAGIPPAVEEREALWLLDHHPACSNYREVT